ncbi:DUF4870 domain-containing protein [Listeria sp. PSOL-1]|uniref:DUF4870 domain-containing protein n=1 Tax=Listeria sp. PSOL-1 TaxID=1844999 RepID=UPI0013D667B9|nr:DUF4870 domain-containing protein [Listeria sp. PSOL-1]
MRNNDKLLAILAYLSYFFLPIILPIIIWVAVSSNYVKKHAKTALFVNILPSIINLLFLLILGIYGLGVAVDDGLIVLSILGVGFILLMNLIVFIWVIVRVVKVATDRI